MGQQSQTPRSIQRETADPGNDRIQELFKMSDPWGRGSANQLDPLAVHFNKKQPVFNHPHHNFKSTGQQGDWQSMKMAEFAKPQGVNAPEPKAGNAARRRGLDHGVEHIKAPTNKESIYCCDYPNWGKIPRPLNLNPGLNKTICDNMPFFGKTSAVNYGGWGTDPDMIGTQAQPTMNNKKRNPNPLGVDIPFLGQTAQSAQFKPFKIAKDSEKYEVPTLKKVTDKYPTFEGQYESQYNGLTLGHDACVQQTAQPLGRDLFDIFSTKKTCIV